MTQQAEESRLLISPAHAESFHAFVYLLDKVSLAVAKIITGKFQRLHK